MRCKTQHQKIMVHFNSLEKLNAAVKRRVFKNLWQTFRRIRLYRPVSVRSNKHQSRVIIFKFPDSMSLARNIKHQVYTLGFRFLQPRHDSLVLALSGVSKFISTIN